MAKQKSVKQSRQRPTTTDGAPFLASKVDRAAAGAKSVEEILRSIPDYEKRQHVVDAVFYAADFMRNARLKAGLTPQQMASSLGCDEPFIREIERGLGTEGPPWTLLVKWMRACGRDLKLRSLVMSNLRARQR